MKDRYWHIQMFKPENRGGIIMDSRQMLKEQNPIIGTGEWNHIQCQYFKGEKNGLAIGDIVMVREGSRPIALCKIAGDCFHDDELTEKYINYWFRNVEVLEWAKPDEQNNLFSQRTLAMLRKQSDTRSWHYINNWYKRILKKAEMKEIVDLLQHKKQIILQGAPGTGKTYIAKDIAEQLILDSLSDDKKLQAERLKTSEQFKLVQFHPSYTYEDFVRGIEVNTESGHAEYVSTNKILGKFARTALKNWQESEIKTDTELSEEKELDTLFDLFIEKIENELDEKEVIIITKSVNIVSIDDDAFRYRGVDGWTSRGNRMLFRDLKKAYSAGNITRQDIKKNSDLSGLARQHASYYVRMLNNFRDFVRKNHDEQKKSNKFLRSKLRNYVLIIDEINRANLPAVLGELIYALEYRGENVESMYAVDGDNRLIVPPNLYIIGTMNTADRSVSQIDYAIRRRFAFVDMLPKALTDPGFDVALFKKVSAFFIKNVDDYIIDPDNTDLERSDYLSDEFSPEDVWIGHSYFIMDGSNRELRLNYEIKPILREYLRDGILKENVSGGKTKVLINTL